jgi:hypothetical protein
MEGGQAELRKELRFSLPPVRRRSPSRASPPDERGAVAILLEGGALRALLDRAELHSKIDTRPI